MRSHVFLITYFLYIQWYLQYVATYTRWPFAAGNFTKKQTLVAQQGDHKKQCGCSSQWLHTTGTTKNLAIIANCAPQCCRQSNFNHNTFSIFRYSMPFTHMAQWMWGMWCGTAWRPLWPTNWCWCTTGQAETARSSYQWCSRSLYTVSWTCNMMIYVVNKSKFWGVLWFK